VAAIDAFTGRVVTENVDVEIANVPVRPIRNLSGMFVFLNPPGGPIPNGPLQIKVTADPQLYLDPAHEVFVPPAPAVPPDPIQRRCNVLLYRRPSFPMASGDTVIGGVLADGADAQGIPIPAPNLHVRVTPEPPPGVPPSPPFVTRSDERGAFAAFLRVERPDPPTPDHRVTFEFAHALGGVSVNTFDRQVVEGRRHAFRGVVDIQQNNAVSPLLEAIGT